MFGCLAHSVCVAVIVLSTEFIVHTLSLCGGDSAVAMITMA